MEFSQLRYFLAALDLGSFSQAATQLRLSQQAVSKSVNRLEQELGVSLFERGGRKLRATAAGEVLAEHARAMDAEASQFLRKLDELSGRSESKLVIGTSPAAAVSVVGKAVRRLLTNHAGARVTVSAGTTQSLTPRLKRGELDAFISVLVQRQADPLLTSEVLLSEPTVLIARAGHPLTLKKTVSLVDTLNYPWLVGTGMDHWGDLVRKSFVDAGLKPPQSSVRTSSVIFAGAFLSETDHLCILPEHMMRMDIEAGRLARVNLGGFSWPRPMALFYRRNSTQSELLSEFIRESRLIAAEIKQETAGP